MLRQSKIDKENRWQIILKYYIMITAVILFQTDDGG